MTKDAHGRAPLVVCLPHGGGLAATFAAWSAGFDGKAEVAAIEYPGHGSRASEPLAQSVEQVAAGALALLDTFGERSLLIFGHSFGAIVGYELARMVESARRPLLGMAVSGCRAPQLGPWAGPPPASRTAIAPGPDDSVHRGVTAMRKLGDIPAILLGDDAYRRRTGGLVGADSALLEAYAYRPKPLLAAPVLVMGGTADPVVSAADLAPWLELTSGGGQVLMFPGGHFYHLRRRAAVVGALDRWLTTRTTVS